MTATVHVLMTGAGAPGAAGIIKCLLQDSRIRLTVADADDNATGRHLHDAFVQIPKADEESFCEDVLAYCTKQDVQLVMPLVTKELFAFSRHQKQFEQAGVRLLVSSAEAIEIANNKGRCYQHLHANGVAVPSFFPVHTADEFIHAAAALGHPQQAFCFKPCVANGSRGFRVVSDSLNETDQLFNQKPYNTFITYAHALKILTSQPFPALVVTEFLPGEEYSVDCLADRGKAVLVVPRLRQKMVNGISVQGRFVYDEEIIRYCTQIIQSIGLHANIGIQLKRAGDGKPLLLEINPRVQGTIVAGLGAGVNLPLLAVKQELGLPIAENEMQVRWGTAFSRHWTEVFY